MKHMKRILCLIVISGVLVFSAAGEKTKLTPKEELGKKLFFDTDLSEPAGQSCATCHAPEVGWSGPDSKINEAGSVYPGALETRFSNRRPPTAAYAGLSPNLHRDEEGTFVGGMFWDGRAAGWDLDDPLAEQAMAPFLNPLEQNLPDKLAVIKKVMASDYKALFIKVWGPGSLSLKDADGTFDRIALAIAAYERSAEVNPYSSKFDDFWRKATSSGLKVESIDAANMNRFKGMGLNDEELTGLMLFNTTGECAECHMLTPENGGPPVFTDFTYDNLGVPGNPKNPFYTMDKKWNPEGKKWVDKGLGGFLETVEKYKKYAAENYGKHKVPTLRNLDKRPGKDFVKAYMHNGFFTTLEEVVNFYNIRDKAGAKWPPPEIKANVNTEELGDLGLTPEEEAAIVTFMKTLSDK